MKKIIILVLIFLYSLFTQLKAQDYEIKNFTLQVENDRVNYTDYGYSHGTGFSVLYEREDLNDSSLYIPFTNYKDADNYISFSFVGQIYTPQDINSSKLIIDDRAYAGFLYLQTTLHQSYENSLKSLTMQVGVVGPASLMQDAQNGLHKLIDANTANGWDNQLSNELIIQINYDNKIYNKLKDFNKIDSAFINDYGFHLGNASTKVYLGSSFVFGYKISDNYGYHSIDGSSYSNIPLSSKYNYSSDYGLTFSLSLYANLIARNIFLDGNSFEDSHSVDKNFFTLNGNFGISARYKDFSISYIQEYSTKEYKTQKKPFIYGSLLFSYNF